MANKYTKTPEPKKSELESLYFGENLSQKEVGEFYGVSQKVVWRWFRDLGIKSRIPYKRNQSGENNDSWRGDNAGYAALHYRVYKKRGNPMKCEKCGTRDKDKRYQWANMTGKYEDVNDYKRLCQSCHAKFDGIIKNINHAVL